MKTYWDSYLDEMGTKLNDMTLRQILEDFYNWYQKQVARQTEQGEYTAPLTQNHTISQREM